MSIGNVNGVLTAYQYAGKVQKMSTKETTFAEKAAATGEAGSTKEISEAEKLEAFKKEIWNEINSLSWGSSVSIQITDEAFKKMMNDSEFKKVITDILIWQTMQKRQMPHMNHIVRTVFTVRR